MTIIFTGSLVGFCLKFFSRRLSIGRGGPRRRLARRRQSTGHDSHGVIRHSRYVDWVRTGDLIPNQSIERIVDTASIGVVDGGFGFGQNDSPMAVDIGIEKAKAAGLSAISLHNSGHIGRVGEWAERAAAAGLISIHFVNAAGSILVAPFGDSSADCRPLRSASACTRERAARRARFRNLTRCRRQGQCRKLRRKAGAGRALIGPDGALSGDPALLYGPLTSNSQRNPSRGPARRAPSAGTKAPVSPCYASSSVDRSPAMAQPNRIADFPMACSRFTSTRNGSIPPMSSTPTRRATSIGSSKGRPFRVKRS